MFWKFRNQNITKTEMIHSVYIESIRVLYRSDRDKRKNFYSSIYAEYHARMKACGFCCRLFDLSRLNLSPWAYSCWNLS